MDNTSAATSSGPKSTAEAITVVIRPNNRVNYQDRRAHYYDVATQDLLRTSEWFRERARQLPGQQISLIWRSYEEFEIYVEWMRGGLIQDKPYPPTKQMKKGTELPNKEQADFSTVLSLWNLSNKIQDKLFNAAVYAQIKKKIHGAADLDNFFVLLTPEAISSIWEATNDPSDRMRLLITNTIATYASRETTHQFAYADAYVQPFMDELQLLLEQVITVDYIPEKLHQLPDQRVKRIFIPAHAFAMAGLDPTLIIAFLTAEEARRLVSQAVDMGFVDAMGES